MQCAKLISSGQAVIRQIVNEKIHLFEERGNEMTEKKSNRAVEIFNKNRFSRRYKRSVPNGNISA